MNVKIATILIVLLLTACTPNSRQTAPVTSVSTLPTVAAASTATPELEWSCPVTLPLAQPFTPPEPYPPTPPGDHFWYGDESLWTALPLNGIWNNLPHNPTGYTQKLLWWREGYSWTEEPEPNLHVTAHRLDDSSISLSESPATNAYAPDIQSAMLIGVDFPTPGCWKVTGHYADAELSYVVKIEATGSASLVVTATPSSPAPAFTPTPVAQITPAPAKTTPTPTPDHSSEIKLATIGEGPCCPRWSPDGQKIAFAIGTGLHKGIYVVDRNGNNFRKLVYIRRSEGDSPPIMPTWTEDNQQILYWNNDEIFSVAADGSNPPQRYNQPAPHVPKPAWFADYQPPSSDTQYYSQLSPDGQYLALTKSKVITPALEHGLYLIPQATAQPVQLFNTHTYSDSLLDFSLRYPTSWALDARDGTNRNDGSGRTIQLVREDYLLAITAQFRPDNPSGCDGLFHQDNDSTDDYRHYQADGVDLWRPKLETGFTNGYNDGTLTFASVISPAPDRNSYICTLEIDNRLFTIDYRLPVSLEVIEAGRHRADILAEMDEILQSIQWHVKADSPPAVTSTATPVHPSQIAPTPTPLGYDATVTAVPGESPPDEISQIKAANANQPEIVAPLFTPNGQWRASTRVYGCVEIGSNQMKSYEELVITDLNAGTEVVAADQLLLD